MKKLTDKERGKVEALKLSWMGDVYDVKALRALRKEEMAGVTAIDKILAIIAPPKVKPE